MFCRTRIRARRDLLKFMRFGYCKFNSLFDVHFLWTSLYNAGWILYDLYVVKCFRPLIVKMHFVYVVLPTKHLKNSSLIIAGRICSENWPSFHSIILLRWTKERGALWLLCLDVFDVTIHEMWTGYGSPSPFFLSDAGVLTNYTAVCSIFIFSCFSCTVSSFHLWLHSLLGSIIVIRQVFCSRNCAWSWMLCPISTSHQNRYASHFSCHNLCKELNAIFACPIVAACC